MANSIASTKNYTALLDEVYQRAACSTCLNSLRRLARAGRNAKEIMIPKIQVSGLGNYWLVARIGNGGQPEWCRRSAVGCTIPADSRYQTGLILRMANRCVWSLHLRLLVGVVARLDNGLLSNRTLPHKELDVFKRF